MTSTVVRLRPAPPEPTLEHPYAQLDWLWERHLQRYRNESTKRGLKNILTAYKKFLGRAHGYDERLKDDCRFYLAVHWDLFALHNVEKYWRGCGLTSHTIHARIKVLRQVMNRSYREGLTFVKFFIDPRPATPRRETEVRAAYTDEELGAIRDILVPEIKYAIKVSSGYKLTGVGRDPRQNRESVKHPPTVSEWKAWDNMVWYFENVLGCQPLQASRENRKKCCGFLKAASRHYGGINAVWRRLGVSPLIDLDLMAPLVMKLAQETGLSPEAIYNLKRDCWRDSHPLTGQPYLRYYKERSAGDMELHVALLDGVNQAQLHLLPKQSEIIKRTINLILSLTAPLVGRAQEAHRDYLLLFQITAAGNKRVNVGDVIRLNKGEASRWARKLIKSRKKSGDDTLPEHINLGRFRPTKITQMVREGHDFFRIQVVAGHSSARTTWLYLENHNITGDIQREVSAALEQIHQNTQEFERNPKPYAIVAPQQQADKVIYKGVLCDCANVYDPPDTVRRLPVFTEGEACTYWNMCLLCPNVIITRKHLPLLISYHREVAASFDGNNLSHAPNAPHYAKMMAVLEGVFRDFGEADLRWAEEIAETSDEYIDPLTYRGVTV